ncbi:MAG: DUF4349 domain-containing protein [Candidatus Nealsonbacteria bacterium]|nr:DUF4349 domain-containing protein [Candidatus Nealsonbacteria bacterium]
MIKKIFKVLGIAFAGFIVFSLILTGWKGFIEKINYSNKSGDYNYESGLGLFSPSTARTGEDNYQKNSGPGEGEETSRLVVKTGTINMIVEDINGSIAKIVQYTEEKSGWVVNSRATESEEVPSGTIAIRVPAGIFGEAMDYFKGLAERVTYEGTSGRDVTEEYIDLQSRLRNLEAAEQQLLEIMERSGTIPEVLSVQRELTSTRNQIEQIKGRMQYLEESAEMSTISINLALSEELLPIPPAEKWRPAYVIKSAWSSLLGSLRSISYFLIWIGVYAIIWVPLGIIVWRIKRFLKKRKDKKE